MADTQRSVSAVLTLLNDNTIGAISPQDVRDAFVSWRNGHGQIYVKAADSAAVTISNTSTYYEVTAPTWTLSSPSHLFDESDGNGRLTYTGDEPMTAHIACSISFTVAGTNDVTYWRIGRNGTSDEASEIHRKAGSSSDVGALALHLIETVDTGDYISLWVRNISATDNVTVEVANLQVVSMIQ